MSSAFEIKENEVKELRNQVKILEQRFESQKITNHSIEEVLKIKEKEIKDLKLVITHLEQNLCDDKVSNSKKIDTFLKEIGEKSQIIKNITNQLKEMDKLKHNNQKSENEILDLQKEISQIKAVMNENEQNYANECNRYINESHCKLQDIDTFKKEIELLKFTIEENEKKYKEQQNNVDEINLRNKSLVDSKAELELKIIDYKISNEKLQDTVKMIREEKESVVNMMKVKIDEIQLEFDKLNKLHKETLSELNQEKLNKISEERSIESVIKDYNLLTEENAYLKKERQKMLQVFKDMLKKFKIDYENFKFFAKEQLTQWSLIFFKHVKQLKTEYSSQIKFYHDNLVETKVNLESIQKAFFSLKSNCIQSLEFFKIEILDKYNKDILTLIFQNNEQLEKRKIDLLRLHEEIDSKCLFML